MSTKSPPTRRKFASEGDELNYLYDKLLYWFYEREDRRRARRFIGRLQQLLRKTDPSRETAFGEECRSLFGELKGDLANAIHHRENEIRRIRRLHDISLGTPSEDYVLRCYDFSDLSDRLDLLAILYHDLGDLDRAIETLKESRRLCRSHRIPFDGQDLLDEYLDDKKHHVGRDGRDGRGRPRKKSAG